MEDNGVICAYPWVHFAYTIKGKIRPCCRFNTGGELSNYKDEFRWLRTRMLYGSKTKECETCYIQGKRSMRENANRDFDLENLDLNEDFLALKSIELSLDNLCNLECKMCDSKFSSNLYKRDKFINNLDRNLGPKPSKVPKSRIDELKNMDINWANLEMIKILGGEPFFSPNFLTILEHIEKNCNISDMTLEVISNCTIIPSDKVLAIMNKFKLVNLTASIDGVGVHNDYQRLGSHYKETIANYCHILNILNNISHPHVHSTYTILTLNFFMADMEYWIEKYPDWSVSFNLVKSMTGSVTSPYHCPDYYYEWLDSKLIITTTKRHVFNKISRRISVLKEMLNHGKEFHEDRWGLFIKSIGVFDSYYDKDIRDFNPELYNLLKDHNEM